MENITSRSSKTYFFSSFEEMVNLVVPIIFILLMIPEVIFSMNRSSEEELLANLYANIFWLNAVHVSFFIAFPFASKRARDWFKFEGSKNGAIFYIAILIFILSFLIYCFTLGIFRNTDGASYIIGQVGSYMLMFIPVFHYMRQSYGLSRIYDNKRISRILSTDYYGFHAVLVLLLIAKINSDFISPEYYSSPLLSIKYISLLIFTSVLLMMFLTIIQNPTKNGLKKIMFQSRLFLYPIGFFFPICGAFTRGVHGIEYYFVMKSLFRNEVVNRKFILAFIGISLMTTVLILIHKNSLPRLFYKQENLMPKWILLSSCALYAVAQVHYWADLFLFSIKESNKIKDTPTSRLKLATRGS